MTDLATAKAAVLKQFQSSLPPGVPSPEQFTIPEMLTRPILSTGVLDHGAHDVIAGTFIPGTGGKLDSWSTADQFGDAYLQMVQDMAYGLSTADQNEITKLKTQNQVVFNNLVTTWEQTFAPITEAEMTAAGVHSKIDYVTAQFTDAFKQSLNWAKFAADYNQAKAAIDIMTNINSAAVAFGRQITGIKANYQTPSQTNGGIQAFDRNNNKVWFPGYNVDPNFPAKFQNGQTVKISVELTDVATSSSSFSIDGQVGGSFPIDFLDISAATSSQYSEQHFKSLMSKAKIELEFDNVCYLTASPSNLTANNTIGWYMSQLLKQAYGHDSDDTGPFFAQQSADHKAVLKAGGLQSLRGLLVSTMPKGKMFFAEDDYASFQKYFHTETHASVSLFGFIPIGSVNTSYTKSSSGSSDKSYAMEVDINPAGDANNLVVHGAVLENPLD
ncbi:hypothetical protein RXV86_12490 [Alisedimentitalea sp. MJ-SS2]|uniref:hypothetical protein n=1 Tax=Aliisedimentitalea sp. MJ-SS2 TaxID=3049795 RepID=UPI002913078A|nr:hypothetical protein [Alisedimentitalea sp. MJ-SS2]MDU8928207.1 hypothetical protein [Alisedimentitalea sp. MJ-SS2]